MDAMTADVDATTQHVDTRWEKALVVVGLVLLAANLRPAATSIGPLLEEVREGLGMSASLAGVLATVPVLCFAAFGMLGPAMARRVGIHRTVFLSVCLMLIGLLWRATASSVPLFLLASALALAGMAASNVLLPALVKRHFPTRIARMTAVYSVALIAGAALPTVTAVPIAHVGGSWRWGLGVWGMLAVLALLPWAVLPARRPRRGGVARRHRVERLAPVAAGLGDGRLLRGAVGDGVLPVRLAPRDLPRRRTDARAGRLDARRRGRGEPARSAGAPDADRAAAEPGTCRGGARTRHQPGLARHPPRR
jgi:MFS family permease